MRTTWSRLDLRLSLGALLLLALAAGGCGQTETAAPSAGGETSRGSVATGPATDGQPGQPGAPAGGMPGGMGGGGMGGMPGGMGGGGTGGMPGGMGGGGMGGMPGGMGGGGTGGMPGGMGGGGMGGMPGGMGGGGGMGGARSGGAAVSGRLLEKLDTGAYSYLRLNTASGELWAAVPQAAIEVGADVTVLDPMPMDGFESKTLSRKFEHIVFGTLGASGGGAPAGGPAGKSGIMSLLDGGAHGHTPGAGSAAAVDLENIKVERAPGPDGYAVADVHAKRAQLQEKTIRVRGKVVKVVPQVMGRNWIHLRDGTGGGRNADLTVTSQTTAAVGDVVTAKGILRVDKDFGSGYFYSAILEEATLEK